MQFVCWPEWYSIISDCSLTLVLFFFQLEAVADDDNHRRARFSPSHCQNFRLRQDREARLRNLVKAGPAQWKGKSKNMDAAVNFFLWTSQFKDNKAVFVKCMLKIIILFSQNDSIGLDNFTFDKFLQIYKIICPRNDIDELFKSM